MDTLISIDARTGQTHGQAWAGSSAADIDTCVRAADAAAPAWARSSGSTRGTLLRALASALESDRDTLVACADRETALGSARLNGELDRTSFQLRRFAQLAEDGRPFDRTEDPAVAGAPPVGHPAMWRQHLPLGPVAMFAASNFPFAFSVLGGDTASALAAGCPVVVKAHPGHPELSLRMHAQAQAVLANLSLPAGLIGLVQGPSVDVGVSLIRHPLVAAGAFTGSTRGGLALLAEAHARPRPIPFFGELGAINPVVALPQVLAAHGGELATLLAGSITQGCGQFCTNPGTLVVIDGPETDRFVQQLVEALSPQTPHVMLTAGMRMAFNRGLEQLRAAGAEPLLCTPGHDNAPGPQLLQVSASRFVANAHLRDEVFGPVSLVVRCAHLSDVLAVLQAIGGSLTATLWGVEEDTEDNRALVRAATAIAGRVLFSGVPTGVAVSAGQHHGGPWPASTAPATTSVGDAALTRFLRPVCLQDAPAWLVARNGRPC